MDFEFIVVYFDRPTEPKLLSDLKFTVVSYEYFYD